jgi:uncharacterized protein YjbJ (UPF0337 family)
VAHDGGRWKAMSRRQGPLAGIHEFRIFGRAITPARAALEHVDDTADDAAIIISLRSGLVCRQMRLNARPLSVAEPEQPFAHRNLPVPNRSARGNQSALIGYASFSRPLPLIGTASRPARGQGHGPSPQVAPHPAKTGSRQIAPAGRPACTSGRLVFIFCQCSCALSLHGDVRPSRNPVRMAAFLQHGKIQKECPMDWNRVEGNWKQLKGQIKERWGKLTDDDLNVINGKRDQLEGKIQERYGYAKDQTKKDIDDWYDTQKW